MTADVRVSEDLCQSTSVRIEDGAGWYDIIMYVDDGWISLQLDLDLP